MKIKIHILVNPYIIYKNSQSCLKEGAIYCQLGVSIVVNLLSEFHHIINLIAYEELLLNEGVISLLLITSYIASLSG